MVRRTLTADLIHCSLETERAESATAEELEFVALENGEVAACSEDTVIIPRQLKALLGAARYEKLRVLVQERARVDAEEQYEEDIRRIA